MRKIFVALGLLVSGFAFADITIKGDGTWECDRCTIDPIGGGKIKVCTKTSTGQEMCATLDSKDYKAAEPNKGSNSDTSNK